MKELAIKAADAIKTVGTKAIFKVKAHSPEILLGIGIAGVVTGTVLACKATLKVDEVLDNFEENKSKIAEAKELIEKGAIEPEAYTEEDVKKDTFITYFNAVKGFAKLYSLPVAIIGTSIACILWSYGILKGRNAAIIAGYNALSQSFDKYRDQVAEAIGEEKENDIYNGFHEVKVEEVVEKNGKEKKVEQVKTVFENDRVINRFSWFFDDFNPEYRKNDPEYNLMYLRACQATLNDIFNSRGKDAVVFMDEVYEVVGGHDRTKDSHIYGWSRALGDTHIDLGIYDIHSPEARAFVNGIEPALLINPNCKHVVIDQL